METKTILITGATDGIGKQTALELAKMGHEIIVHGRDKIRGDKVTADIKNSSLNEKVHYINADFTKFNQIKEFAIEVKNRFSNLDVLLNNAGVFENDRIILPNGLERTFMINHMAPFTLTNLLMDLIKNTKDSRIINVSSIAQAGTMDFDNLNGEKYFDAYNAYALSKLENVLFTYKLHRDLKKDGPTINCLHPGVISTKLLHAGWGIGGGSLTQGASTSIYLANSVEVEDISGKYFVNSQQRKSSAISYDLKIQDRLWEISKEIMNQHI